VRDAGAARPSRVSARIFASAKIRRRTRPPPLAGRVCVPHGANPSRQGRGTRSELGRTRPARGGGGLPRPWRDGAAGVPRPWRGRPSAGTGGSRPARGGGRHPHGSDSTSEPTPPYIYRGGATIPYIYKGIVAPPLRGGRFARRAPSDFCGRKNPSVGFLRPQKS